MILKFLTNPIVVLVITFDVLAVIFYKKIIGIAGEYWVKRELKKLPAEYLILNDIMLKTQDGHTHQIDHLVISQYGIFVIETKQYNGYIKGNDYDKKWIIYSGKQKYFINNPIHQNYGHIQALKELLSVDELKLISIVCISSNAKTSIHSKVAVRLPYLLDRIREHKTEILPEYINYYHFIKDSNITSRLERRNHIKYAKQQKTKKEQESIGKCPKCGNRLIEKNGKYGNFIGCSNYPRCKYTKKN